MKFFAALVMTAFFSTSAMASGLDMFKVVVDSDALATLEADLAADSWSLVKLENTATYRCPSCFDYEATFTKYDADRNTMVELKKTLHTSLVLGGDISVRVQD